jgi:hypothetical protein
LSEITFIKQGENQKLFFFLFLLIRYSNSSLTQDLQNLLKQGQEFEEDPVQEGPFQENPLAASSTHGLVEDLHPACFR